MNTKRTNTHNLITIGLLGAVSFILMFITTSIPPFPSFLKFDISDLPSAIALPYLGIKGAIYISFIKNLLHIFVTPSAGIGELINFLMSSIFLFLIYLFFKVSKNSKYPFFASAIITGFLSVPINYFIMFPLYRYILNIDMKKIILLSSVSNPLVNDLASYFLLTIVPFNIIKFSLVSLLYFSINNIGRKLLFYKFIN